MTNTDWFKGFGDIEPEVPTELAVLLIADCCELLEVIKTWPANTKHLDRLILNRTREIVHIHSWINYRELFFSRDAVANRLAFMLYEYLQEQNDA